MQLSGSPRVNFLINPLFLGGGVLGVLSILAGVFVLTEEFAHYFPLGVLLSLVIMALAMYNDSRKSAQRKAVQKDVEALEEERIELERKFVHEGASIAAYMRAVGVGTAGELKEKADNYRYFLSLRNDNEEGRQRIPPVRRPRPPAAVRAGGEVAELGRRRGITTFPLTPTASGGHRAAGGGTAPVEHVRFGAVDNEFLPMLRHRRPPAKPGFDASIAGRIGGIEMERSSRSRSGASGICPPSRVSISGSSSVDGSPIVHAKDDSIIHFGAEPRNEGPVYFASGPV
jgi:hypothetical protein